MDYEKIVLLDEDLRQIGSAAKIASHHLHTPLHLAFSCYIFNDQNQLLVTQRAHSKHVWPSVWTNSVCGHPAPNESLTRAIERRAKYELGISRLVQIECMLPDYRYTTPAMNGVIENEFCPVHVARLPDISDTELNPEEVEEYRWVDWDEYILDIKHKPDKYSYWTKQQAPLLNDLPEFNRYLENARGVQ